ncbi:MAG: ABC transporter substrate-binding protein [Gracilibacteraceae bacterium]|jgi:spermidine/putrescine transport system substrate-binding protein|nr:ABC transporter substrate-binding protein [Gracilibacteraceae bacterium]
MKKNQNLAKISILCLCLVVTLTGAGCGASAETIIVYNWGDYIDQSVLDDFERESGINVIYEEFDTNESMYAKIKAGGTAYDVAFPSDYMIKRMIDEGGLEKINLDNIPNYAYIDDRFKNMPYDPENEYSVPYFWGTVGILYNKTMVDEPVDSWEILWNEKYANEIFMLDSQRDSIGLALKMLGYSLNSRDEAELAAAQAALIEQIPLVRAYVGDEVKDMMIAGEGALAVVWSGDALNMMLENENLDFALPREGTNIWVDAMVIPTTSKHKEAAEKFINYMCETEIAARNCDYINYSSPHTEVVRGLPAEITSDIRFYPGENDLANSEVFQDLAALLPIYDRIWTEVKAAYQ